MPWPDAMDGDMDDYYYGPIGPAGRIGGGADQQYAERYSHDNSARSSPLYQFNSLEELVTSEVFQQQLGMALECKNKQIAELRQELIDKHPGHPSTEAVFDQWEWIQQNQSKSFWSFGYNMIRKNYCYSGFGTYGFGFPSYYHAYAAANRYEAPESAAD